MFTTFLVVGGKDGLMTNQELAQLFSFYFRRHRSLIYVYHSAYGIYANSSLERIYAHSSSEQIYANSS